MFKVYCRSKSHRIWCPYSQPFDELDDALKANAKYHASADTMVELVGR